MDATLLVTGGAGFIGSNLVRHLLACGPPAQRLINLDLLTYAGNLDNLAGVAEQHPERYQFVQGDICDLPLLQRLFADHDVTAVLNLAAESHVDRSIVDPGPFVRTNVLGTATLLHAALHAWPPGGWGGRRFLQVSTDEVYGSLPLEDKAARFTELSPLAPHSPYAASKAAADLLVQSYHDTYGFPTLVTRCCNNYGPYQFPEKMIPRMIALALRDQPLPLYGDGRDVRDWISVADHCRALARVLQAGRPGATYNIGAGVERENLEVVQNILDLLEKPHSLIRFVADRPGHDRRYAIDPARIERELGWNSAESFEERLAATVDWYAGHRDWVERIRTGEYRCTDWTDRTPGGHAR